MLVQFVECLPEYERRIRADERERCAKIADKYVERTNADIAHAIAKEIRSGE